MSSLTVSPIVANVRAFYDRTAAAYVERTFHLDMSKTRRQLTRLLLPGARVLDAGCGSGRDALAFAQAGFEVDAFDASPEMVALARAHTGLDVACHTFEDVTALERYDGIWACASLVHLDDEGLLRALKRLMAALKVGGVIFMSLKKGEGLRFAEDGRVFNDFTLERLTEMEPLRSLELLRFTQNLSTLNQSDVWLNAVFRKV